MKLQVTSLRGVDYQGDIKSLNIKTTSGEVTILDNHLPLVTVLKAGMAHIVDTKETKKDLEIKSGFLEVSPENKVNVLID